MIVGKIQGTVLVKCLGLCLTQSKHIINDALFIFYICLLNVVVIVSMHLSAQ